MVDDRSKGLYMYTNRLVLLCIVLESFSGVL